MYMCSYALISISVKRHYKVVIHNPLSFWNTCNVYHDISYSNFDVERNFANMVCLRDYKMKLYLSSVCSLNDSPVYIDRFKCLHFKLFF